ncbi:MAG: hypothetical protein HY873_02965 [Chloroflexi bacterium]|nr:hypothetical protein [Chloroflexota bacterium]
MTRESGSIISAVSGDSVEIDQSAVRSIDAERVEMRSAAARDVRSETMDLDDSAVFTLRANDVQMRDCAAIAVIADNVTQSGDSSTVFLLARRVEGDIRATFTPASAFALGLGAVLGIWIIRRIRRITG